MWASCGDDSRERGKGHLMAGFVRKNWHMREKNLFAVEERRGVHLPREGAMSNSAGESRTAFEAFGKKVEEKRRVGFVNFTS